MIHTSRHADVDVPSLPVTEFVLRQAEDLASQPALVEGASGRTIRFGELARAIKALAGGLTARGFGPGKVLAIMAPNVPEYAVVFHGTAYAGGIVTTINPTYTAGEVKHQLQDSGASLLVTVSMFADVAKEAAEGTGVEEVFTIDESPLSHFKSLLGEPLSQHAEVSLDDVACLPYSSGTTGLSKGVMLTHRNLVANLVQTDVMLPIRRGEAVLSFLPFFHIYGMQILMNRALAAGAKVVTMPRFDLEQFLNLCQQHEARRAFVVPPVVLALAKHPLVDKFDLSSLEQVFSGAAPLGVELTEEAGARLHCEVSQGYGMTELSPVSHAVADGYTKAGTIGTLTPSTECVIVDPDSGERLGVGEPGELWIRGPQVMKGYLNNEEATKATIDEDGWLHTGDIAQVDEEGFFTIVDRLKELIKYKGFQVPPAELEALLVGHPGIADAAVVGVPDAEAGELPKAFITLQPNATLSENDIKTFVADKVAHYKQLRLVEFVDEIPKSASGKILRRMLRNRG
ncbi:MAG: 4-coumarate--CoA ligase family protein [Myxococcota bacterium]